MSESVIEFLKMAVKNTPISGIFLPRKDIEKLLKEIEVKNNAG